MWLAVMVVAVVGSVVASRLRAWRKMVSLARAGAGAAVEPLPPDEMTPRQQELLTQMGRLGFRPEEPFRVRLGKAAPGHYANARGDGDTTWFRSLSIEGEDPSGLTLISYFPGGQLVSSSTASHAVDPREVVQCIPDAAPGKLHALHREALFALFGLGVGPTKLPVDLPARIIEEWRAEAALILDRSVLSQILFSRQFWRTPHATMPVAKRSDLAALAAQLKGTSSLGLG